jgi:TRAP-type transport system small permease protein
MDKMVDRLFKLLQHFCVASLVVLVFFVFTNVALRFIFKSGVTVFEELARWTFVWMIFVGAIVALRNNTHLGTDAVVTLLPRGARRVVTILASLITFGCVVVFLVGSWTHFQVSKDITAPVSNLSVGYFYYGTGLVFGVAAVMILLARGFNLLTGRLDPDSLLSRGLGEESAPVAGASDK